MEMKENDKILYSLNDYVAQLFSKVLYATKNSRRRLILEAFNEHKTRTEEDIQQYLKRKGVIKDTRGYSKGKLRKNHLIPLVEAKILEEGEDHLFEITSFGKEIKQIIGRVKELGTLTISPQQTLYPERVLLKLRKGSKRYSKLKSKIYISTFEKIIQKLVNRGLVRVNHPCGSPHIHSLSHFTTSSYYPFIQSVKTYPERTGRSWFTEYSITHYLAQEWKEKVGRPIDIDEIRELLKKGVEVGDIVKTDGSYKPSSISDPLESLKTPGRKVFNSIKEGYDTVREIKDKSGLSFASTYKILSRLKEKNLIEEHKEYVTIELTEKGRKLADCLFQIKECVINFVYTHKAEFQERVEVESE
ncbi:hypothetical protein KJA16_00545 [Patescibacteria group bacterium]|nr:hypothetical protein [Patescibacteria group bacterium]